MVSRDNVVVVGGCSQGNLAEDLTDFVEEYADPEESIEIELNSAPNDLFVLTFPSGISFELFCYLVNFLRYPFRKGPSKSTAHGYRVLRSTDHGVPSELAGKRCQIFSYGEPDAEEDSVVWVVTEQNVVYQTDLARGRLRVEAVEYDCTFDPMPVCLELITPVGVFKSEKDTPQQVTEEDIGDQLIFSRVFFLLVALVLGAIITGKLSVGPVHLFIGSVLVTGMFPFFFGDVCHLNKFFREWLLFTLLLYIVSYTHLHDMEYLGGRAFPHYLSPLRMPLFSVVFTRIGEQWYFKRFQKHLNLTGRGVFEIVFMMGLIAGSIAMVAWP